MKKLPHRPSFGLIIVALVALAVWAAGCAQGGTGSTTSPASRYDAGTPMGDAAITACGSSGAICCEGYCDDGLSCIDGLCEVGTGCGGDSQPCCTSMPYCDLGLECFVGGCSAATPPPPSSCGALDEACCGAGACNAGLTCEAGLCAMAGSEECGEPGQPCCSGSCFSPSVCEAGTCSADTGGSCGVPGDFCGTSADCCSGLPCASGVCGGSTGGGSDPCASATTCAACVAREVCGFCDGRCVESDYFGPLDGSYCDYYSWFSFEC